MRENWHSLWCTWGSFFSFSNLHCDACDWFKVWKKKTNIWCLKSQIDIHWGVRKDQLLLFGSQSNRSSQLSFPILTILPSYLLSGLIQKVHKRVTVEVRAHRTDSIMILWKVKNIDVKTEKVNHCIVWPCSPRTLTLLLADSTFEALIGTY